MSKSCICIICPRSCDLTVDENEVGEIIVTGNQCKRGDTYGKSEFSNPTRTLTTTVKVTNSNFTRLPVMSSEPVPKKLLKNCLDLLYDLEVNAPIKMGDIIVKNILETNVDVVATRDIS